MDVLKLGATFLLLSETVKAFPTFLPPITKVRHISPHTVEADDIRAGYVMAIAWSLVVAIAIHRSTNQKDVYLVWTFIAGSMLFMYEMALQDTRTI